ncbi:MAG: acylphosphatase [Chitinispirillaceae bacterium]|nr:acylphosphatase [Chitinispirillaceae bacterium]
MQVLRWSIVVQGRVQGVGFRYFTASSARNHGLVGWVRNRDDRGVEMEVQGSPEMLAVFRVEINKGPILARVQEMKVVELPPVEGEEGFEIRY